MNNGSTESPSLPANGYADHLRDLEQKHFSKELLSALPPHLIKKYRILPLETDAQSLTIAACDASNTQIIQDLRFACQKEIRLASAPPDQIERLIKKHFEHRPLNGRAKKNEPLTIQESPIAEYVTQILNHAIRNRASDIHFEPFEKEFKIRYRVDGILHEIPSPDFSLSSAITSRLKVLAHMDIAEQRSPQDGRFQIDFENRIIDFRASTLPTHNGESLVLRILDKSAMNLALDQLGMPSTIYKKLLAILRKPSGIFIVTGPTGSGKTTTLYACLNKLHSPGIKILTAEDPVEYELEGIQQVSIHEEIGLTFSHLLRSFLRHDPDKILVGEIRDFETAQMAIQASLTGHAVLTSLHTNDATEAITRLMDMGIEPFLIAASLEAVLAQRLVRKICPACKIHHTPHESLLASLNLHAENIFYQGKGCPQCMNTGYKGRMGIFELFEINDTLRAMILPKISTMEIREKAVAMGMNTLRADGLQRCLEGATTLQEILKYT